MSILPPDIHILANRVITGFAKESLRLTTAESCTGGLVAGALTDVPGSSAVFERGFIAYDNQAKTELLAVMPDRIEEFGAVSAEIASDMAVGALEFSNADIAISVTGIAGPTGGGPLKPVGAVHFGIAKRDGTILLFQSNFTGNRDRIRLQATAEALRLLEIMTGGGDLPEL